MFLLKFWHNLLYVKATFSHQKGIAVPTPLGICTVYAVFQQLKQQIINLFRKSLHCTLMWKTKCADTVKPQSVTASGLREQLALQTNNFSLFHAAVLFKPQSCYSAATLYMIMKNIAWWLAHAGGKTGSIDSQQYFMKCCRNLLRIHLPSSFTNKLGLISHIIITCHSVDLQFSAMLQEFKFLDFFLLSINSFLQVNQQ